METDPYDTRHSSSPLGRTARGAGGWLRRHPLGALQILLLILVSVSYTHLTLPTTPYV